MEESSAIAQLKKDKHTLLEGYVTEYLFEQQFLLPQRTLYTHGWWSGTLRGKRFFFAIKRTLSKLDMDIMRILSSAYICWVVENIEGSWWFKKDNELLTLEQFIKEYSLSPQQSILHATVETSNSDRQEECIKFFKQCGLLSQIAEERNFVDDVLSVYFKGILNVDFFTRNRKNKLCVIEVKFKNESRDGCFGINIGEVLLFEELKNLGMLVYQTILYKNRSVSSIQNTEVSVFSYLRQPHKEKKWYMIPFNKGVLEMPSVAPSYTSVDGKRSQSYYRLKKNRLISEQNVIGSVAEELLLKL